MSVTKTARTPRPRYDFPSVPLPRAPNAAVLWARALVVGAVALILNLLHSLSVLRADM